MTDKVWTATDLEMGKMTIIRRGDALNLERRYEFLDGTVVLEEISTGRLRVDMPISEVPGNILDALQVLDTWTKNQALEKEGML